jgi:hypothetical protein
LREVPDVTNFTVKATKKNKFEANQCIFEVIQLEGPTMSTFSFPNFFHVVGISRR